MMSVKYLAVLGIAIHVILLYSIFDIYFFSPISHGIMDVNNTISTPCERVVFISIDGLRLDALLEEDKETGSKVAPFLRHKMTEWSAWGESTCHLPTESRPGHVAMLAGFYEDPSAVFKGWKENPVDFDSIFNRSKCSFSWGSPDIVNIFYKALKHDCAHSWTYSEHQDFSGDTMEYDNWVYKNVENFFNVNGSFINFPKSGAFFFLHLLGQDTSGHTHKPWTYKYKENLRNVDRIIMLTDELFQKMFPSNKTTFIVSADHGMTDWGSHGSGDPSETQTPIVTWGCGIKKRSLTDPNIVINQADITPLLAVLLGVPIPVNSIGVLPHVFLNLSKLFIAEAIFLNAEQITHQYLVKRLEVVSKLHSYLVKPFPGLDDDQLTATKNAIKVDLQQGRPDSANEKSLKLLKLSLKGMWYYQNYFQSFLLACVVAIIFAWTSILFLYIKSIDLPWDFSIMRSSFLASLVCIISFIIYKQQFPLTYHAYVLLPLLLWWLLLRRLKALCSLASVMTIKNILYSLILIAGVEVLVVGFFHRWVLSINLAAMTLWPFLTIKLSSRNWKLFLCWVLSAMALSTFTHMPVVGKEHNPFLPVVAAALLCVGSLLCCWNKNLTIVGRAVALLRGFALLASGATNYFVQSMFIIESAVNPSYHIISWLLLILSALFLFEPSSDVVGKMIKVCVALAIPFILLCVSHEGFFLIALFVQMFCWIKLEMLNESVVGTTVQYLQYVRKKLHDDVAITDFRKAQFFLSYIYVAFFGVGNLASVSSFDPAWVRCFITTFSPFIMTALILLKVIIPFFVVCVALRVLTVLLHIRPYKIFLIVLIYCNLMGVNFLFLVRNEGSWLHIGSSLSHYAIQQLTVVFLLFLHLLAQVMIPVTVL